MPTINSIIADRSARRPAVCLCENCSNEGIYAVPIAKRGGKPGFICDFHAHHKLAYSTRNESRRGTRKVHGFTFAPEMETAYSSLRARGEFLDFGFLPTQDGTVDVEYKSPIHEGLNGLSKQFVSFERLISEGELRIDGTCGTHFHVGHVEYINAQTMRWLRRFNGSLFVPLSQAIMADPEKSAHFFGRRPNRWAEPVTFADPSGDYEGWRMKHSAMFNLQHDYTIEFRQAKFVNAKQYTAVAKFARDCTNAIIENFIKHFNDTDFDRRRYDSRTAYRKHKAEVTANKLVKLYEKYTANI